MRSVKRGDLQVLWSMFVVGVGHARGHELLMIARG